MNLKRLRKWPLAHRPSTLFPGSAVAVALLAGSLAAAGQPGHSTLILTSSNDPAANNVLVFKLDAGQSPSLQLASKFPTGGKGRRK